MPTPTWSRRGNSHMYPASPGVKRTTIGDTPGANQPAAMVKREGGVGDRKVRRTRDPAPSAPTMTSNDSERPDWVRRMPATPRGVPPARSTATTRSATCTAPASTARRSSHASMSRRVRGRLGQQGQGLGRQPTAARLLAGVRGVEDGDRRAAPGQPEREQGARGPRAHHRDLHGAAAEAASTAATTSSGVAVAVPSLATTTPAA